MLNPSFMRRGEAFFMCELYRMTKQEAHHRRQIPAGFNCRRCAASITKHYEAPRRQRTVSHRFEQTLHDAGELAAQSRVLMMARRHDHAIEGQTGFEGS